MFKTKSRHLNDPPATPHIKSVSLPGDSCLSATMRGRYDSMLQKSSKSALPVVDRRSATPAPPRTQRDSMYGHYENSTRTRTVSLLSGTPKAGPLKSILKPPKPASDSQAYSSSLYTPVPTRPEREKSFLKPYPHPKQSDSYAKPCPAPSEKPTPYFKQAKHLADDDMEPLKPSKARYTPLAKNCSQSDTETMPKKYLHTRTVPIKEEAIALSWPLVDFHRRRRLGHPSLYFDVGFDPRLPLNIRVSHANGGCYIDLSQTQREVQVSTHCVVTSMSIIWPLAAEYRQPIYVDRKEGIRCIDVFGALFTAFQGKLSPRERSKVMELEHRDPRRYQKFLAAFERRCHDSPGLTEFNRKQGWTRADLLVGKRIFKGLHQSGPHWVLSLDGWDEHS